MGFVREERHKQGSNEHNRRHYEVQNSIPHGSLIATDKRIQNGSSRYEDNDVRDVRGGPVDAQGPVVPEGGGEGLSDEDLEGRVADAVSEGVDDYRYEGYDVGRLEDHDGEAGEDLEAAGDQEDGLCPPVLAVEVGEDDADEVCEAAENEGKAGGDVGRREKDVLVDRIDDEKEGEKLEDRIGHLLKNAYEEKKLDLFVLLQGVKIIRHDIPQFEL